MGDFFSWYNRERLWVRLLVILPILPVALLTFTVKSLYGVPYLLIESWWKAKQFRRKLRAAGLIGDWEEVKAAIENQSGTLIVEMWPNNPHYSWWVPQRREEIDPDLLVPTWGQFEIGGWDIIDESPGLSEQLDNWSARQLTQCEGLAKAVSPSSKQIAELSIAAKRHSVIVLPGYCSGTLTGRFASIAS